MELEVMNASEKRKLWATLT